MRIAATATAALMLAICAAPAQAQLPADAEAILAVVVEHSNTVDALSKDPQSEPNQRFRARGEQIAECLRQVTESPGFTAKSSGYKKKFKKSVAIIGDIDDGAAPIMAYSPLIAQTEQKLLALPLTTPAYQSSARAGAKLLSLWRQRDAAPADGQWLTCRYAKALSKAKKITGKAEVKAFNASRLRSVKQERLLYKQIAQAKKALKQGRKQLVKDGASKDQFSIFTSFFQVDDTP